MLLAIIGLIAGVALLPLGVEDFDGLLARDATLSLHYWLVFLCGGNPYLLIPINIALFLIATRTITRLKPNPATLALVISPFAIANVLDAFNRYALTMFLFTMAATHGETFRERTKTIVVASAATALMHPINFLAAFFAPISFSLLVTIVIGIVVAGESIFTYLTVFSPDKAQLFSSLGLEMAAAYGGNFKLDLPEPNLSLDFVASLFSALLLFPLWLSRGASSYDWALCAFMLLGYLGLLTMAVTTKSPLRLNVFLASIILLAVTTTFVGNLAVIYRHIGPLFPLAIVALAAHRRSDD